MRSLVVVPLLAFVLALAAVPACTTRGTTPGHDTGTHVGGDDTGVIIGPGVDANFPDTGTHSTNCSAAAQLIYLVDSANAFLRYDPGANVITRIGTLDCPGTAMPFSMAVSRDAVAYVLHGDHNIYAVSTTDASCQSTPFVPNQMSFQLFGMGFVSDEAGGTAETLFIGGGPALGIGSGSATLGSIHLADWSVTTLGSLGGSPELTGNGLGELWGFFPDSTPMSVRRLDKSNGGTLELFDVSPIDTAAIHAPAAWAFAYWGGRYYMFYQGAGDASSGIYRLTPDTTAVETVMSNTGFRIVGAGVSTCAPTILI